MAAHRRPSRSHDDDKTVDGRIAWIEVIGFTAVILLIALLASGWFDVMLPWT
jgi:hypothetical protein